MSDRDPSRVLLFSCPLDVLDVLPRPVPAAQGLPDWLKAMPAQAFNAVNLRDDNTVKRCPPFIDAMTSGFLIPLLCDVKVQNGEFTWDNDLPSGGDPTLPRSPIGFHDASQVIGSPLFQDDRFLIKFHNAWTIKAPEGYGVLFTHPFNRPDLPFTTLTGMVDCDLYHDNRVHFPAHWHDMAFEGVLPKGTPIAQCIPVLRETWTMRVQSFTDDDAHRVQDLATSVSREPGLYRRQYRA